MKRQMKDCPYCDNPSAFSLLDSTRVEYEVHQFNAEIRTNLNGDMQAVGWETVKKTKLLHPPAVPITGFQGVECAHE